MPGLPPPRLLQSFHSLAAAGFAAGALLMVALPGRRPSMLFSQTRKPRPSQGQLIQSPLLLGSQRLHCGSKPQAVAIIWGFSSPIKASTPFRDEGTVTETPALKAHSALKGPQTRKPHLPSAPEA